jgi:phosphatidylethanolamine/phosphatidyl-N-methylethanolamine N-methyltransferase
MIENLARETALTKARYDRIAPVYDAMEWPIERFVFQPWRQELWSRVPKGRVLEVGVGTGKNFPYHPPGAQITGIDLSEGMLARARRRAEALGLDLELGHMDAQDLDFADDSFDAAVATFVFCSVPLPIQGLRELGRVVQPGGDIWLLEHVRVDRPVLGPLMDGLNPVLVRMSGANINRQTVENVARAGLELISVENLKADLVKLIHARP